MAERNLQILKPHLILCEGQDEFNFLLWYLLSDARAEEDPRFANDVQIVDFGGVNDLPRFLKMLRLTPGFDMVRSVLIVQDAETDAVGSAQRIRTALANNGFSAPEKSGDWTSDGTPHFAYLLFPDLEDAAEEGTLEDLCLQILRDEFTPSPVIAEIEDDISRLREAGLREFPHAFKTKLHGFFSLTDPFIGLKIGEAAKAGAFNWRSVQLEGLNQCLLEGFSLE